MNGLKHLLCPIYNNKTCLSKPGLRIMKIVTENSTGQFITNCMRQHFNAKCDTAYYKLRWCLYMIYFKVLKHISNHFNFQLQTIILTSLTSYIRKLICIMIYYFRIPHDTFCLFSNLHKFLLSKALQEIFNPPNSLCVKGGKQCIMGNSNHSILSIYTNEFSSKMNQNREKIIII